MVDLLNGSKDGDAGPALSPGAGAPLVPGPAASILASPRAPAFLGSRKNLVGCALAVVGVVVALTGLVGPFWPLLVGGLYVAGVGLTPAPRLHQLQAADDLQDVRRALTAQVQALSGRVPAEVMSRVSRIENIILALLPKAEQLPAGSEDRYILRATALEYLPAALDSYLNMPRDYAAHRRIDGDRTPEAELVDQLSLLESKMVEISEDFSGNDSQRLLANGRFLREKFGHSELQAPRLEDGPS